MKIAIHIPKTLPLSIRNYMDNISKEIANHADLHKFTSVKELEKLKNLADLLWLPYCAGGAAPPIELCRTWKKNTVITLHGAAPFVVPRKSYYSSAKEILKGEIHKLKNIIKWNVFWKHKIDRIITVSKYAKQEIVNTFNLPSNLVIPIYHGVDLTIFKPLKEEKKQQIDINESYFLHISQYQPKKNVDRIIEAYRKLPNPKPKLILITPGHKKNISDENIIFIREPQDSTALAKFYQKALAFIFPSIHETFGMPILEAMACGCPVITSNISACAEVAGEAALLINPYSVKQITEAMQRLIEDSQLREELSQRGKKRAREFSWKKSALQHLKVFEEILREDKR